MKTTVNTIDSQALGQTVVDLSEVSAVDNFLACEREYLARHAPAYVACRLPIEELATLHWLERHGFQFIETLLRMSVQLKRPFDTTPFPYRFERVETAEMLEPVLEIAANTFVDDRYSIDPLIPQGVSGARYRGYVHKSFEVADEEVYRLVSERSGEVVAFKTHRITGEREGLFLLGGVKNEYKRTAIPAVSEYCELNVLRERGIEKMTTHVSARNYAVMNLEIKGLGFRVEGAFAVLRKIYGK